MAGLGLKGEYDLTVIKPQSGRKETYLLKFGTNSTALFCQERGIGFQEFQQVFANPGPAEILDFLWSALLAGAKTTGKEVTITKHQLGDHIDEMEMDELEAIFDVITEATDPGELKNSQGPKETTANRSPGT